LIALHVRQIGVNPLQEFEGMVRDVADGGSLHQTALPAPVARARAIAPADALPYMASRRPRGVSMLFSVFQVLDLLLQVLTWIIILQAVLSWLVAFNVINTHSDFVRSLLSALDRLTEPLYRPIRRILPDFGGIDFSPLVVLLLVYVARILLSGLAADLAY
jgi:YggT family protein